MAKATEINLRVLDGLTKCTSGSGVEIVFRIPRKSLAKCKDIRELKNGGIYLLLGERDGRQMIYIGHGIGGLFDKLCEHDRADKNFFTEAIVFTTADNSFSARELVWLEDKFFDELKGAGRVVVKIGKDEQPDAFEDRAEFARVTLNAIGCKIFEPSKVEEPAEEIFYFSRNVQRIGHIPDAKMKRTPTGYRVLAGSEISSYEIPKLSMTLKKRRHTAKIDANRRLLEDEEFTSAILAAQFVIGNYAHLTDWQTRDGLPPKNTFQGGN